jgi:acetylornithine deacetylase/succinyl-diaminopimelate desuccinylase-like protein
MLPSWPAVRKETVAHLQKLIRARTVNPPGNEVFAARYLAAQLATEDIPFELLEPAAGRAIVVARLTGNGSAKPVMLLAHMDVVGVESAKWSVDPFAAEIRDGWLYGRGAIDDKGMLAANLEAMLLLKRHVIDWGGTLARDVIMVATSDEEAGGTFGIDWLLAHHPRFGDAELALNEGGRCRVIDGRLVYVAVQTAEKVPHVVRLSVCGPGGHASVPLGDTALTRLGRALVAIGAHREPLDLTPTTTRFFRALAQAWPTQDEGCAMEDVVSGDPDRVHRAEATLLAHPVLDALLRAGVSATIVEGGVRANVIPTEAHVTLDIRTLPGRSVRDTLERLRAAIGDSSVESVVLASGDDAPASSFDTPMFRAIEEVMAERAPGTVVVPYLSTGATDSAKLRSAGVQAYGLLPFPMTESDEARMHGHDERISLDALEFGTRVIFETIRRVATAAA